MRAWLLNPWNSRNTGQQHWVLVWMHLRISIKGSHLSFYACGGLCLKDPVKESLLRMVVGLFLGFLSPLKFGLLLQNGYACDSWEEFGVIVYPYQFYRQSINQSSDQRHSLRPLVPERPCLLLQYSLRRKCAGTQKYMKGHQNGVHPPTQNTALQQAGEASWELTMLQPLAEIQLVLSWSKPNWQKLCQWYFDGLSSGYGTLLWARACLCTSWASELTAVTFVTGIQRGGCCCSQVLHLYGVLKSYHVSHWGRPKQLWVF